MTVYMDATASALVDVGRMYPMNSVPPSPTYPYGVYSAGLGGADGYSLGGSHGLRLGGVTVQTFGKTAEASLAHMEKCLARLLDLRLADDATPLRAGLDTPALNRDPDDDGVVTFTMPLTFTQEA